MTEFPYIAEYNSNVVPNEVIKKDTYKNHMYVIYSVMGSHPTAYVRVNEGEKWYDVDYDKISFTWPGCNPHGGFTFSDFVNEESFGEPGAYWVGWDYAHFGDYKSYPLDGILSMIDGAKKWTIEEIEADCKKVIDYMESLYESTNNE
jgi:hypothetical protein